MSISTEHPQYAHALPLWQLMQHVLDGEREIKRRGVRYLPKPSGIAEAERVKTESADQLYSAYLARAQFPEWLIEARRAMAGMVSRLTPKVALPDALAGIEKRATADDFDLKQLFVRAVREVLTFGRLCMLADIDEEGKPFIVLYSAVNAINWKEDGVGGRKRLTLTVLRENHDIAGDEFSHQTVPMYRVLALDEAGKYHIRLFDEGGTIRDEPRATTARGEQLNYIPLVFCGSTDTTPDVDEIPLLSMARCAIKYYQLSADYFASLYYTSHPQPWVSDSDTAPLEDDEEHGPRGEIDLSVAGPSVVWILPPGAKCGYLEFTGAGISANREEMDKQKAAGFEAGARAMDIGAQESGDARKARQDDQRASLATAVSTVAESIERLLKMAAEWVGADPDDVTFQVEPEFTADSINPQVLNQLNQLVGANKISANTVWEYLTTGKLPEHNYEFEQAMLENPNPADIPE